MNDALKEILSKHIEGPKNYETVREMRRLRPTEADFTDELFDCFDANGRRMIYTMLIAADYSVALSVLEHRISTETDKNCKRKAQFMLGVMKDNPPTTALGNQ